MRPIRICAATFCSLLLALPTPDRAVAQTLGDMLRAFDGAARQAAPRSQPRVQNRSRPSAERSVTVREAQTLLNALGFNAGPADGLMGPRTRAAIEAFQRDYGQQATGTLDERTLRVLAGAALGIGLETDIAVPGLADEIRAPGLSGLYRPQSPGLLPLAVHGVPYNDEEVLDVDIGDTSIRAARVLPTEPGEPFVFARDNCTVSITPTDHSGAQALYVRSSGSCMDFANLDETYVRAEATDEEEGVHASETVSPLPRHDQGIAESVELPSSRAESSPEGPFGEPGTITILGLEMPEPVPFEIPVSWEHVRDDIPAELLRTPDEPLTRSEVRSQVEEVAARHRQEFSQALDLLVNVVLAANPDWTDRNLDLFLLDWLYVLGADEAIDGAPSSIELSSGIVITPEAQILVERLEIDRLFRERDAAEAILESFVYGTTAEDASASTAAPDVGDEPGAATPIRARGGSEEVASGLMTFDCDGTLTPTQATTCANPVLRNLDRDLAEAQRERLATATGDDAAEERQLQPIRARQREKCGTDEACIEESYLADIGLLRWSLQRSVNTGARADADPGAAPASGRERVPAAGIASPNEIPEPLTAFRDCDICPEMMALPSGSFWMGATEEDAAMPFTYVSSELPRHEVTFDYRFAIGRFNVTVAEFAAFVDATGFETGGPCHLRLPDRGPNAGRFVGTVHPLADAHNQGTTALGPGGGVLVEHADFRTPGTEVSDDQPATCISRNEVMAYLEWLSEKTGRSYRLPTEAEWEYAVRAGEVRPFFFGGGQEELCDYANFADRDSVYSAAMAARCAERPSLEYTYPVGSFKPNAWGLHDMVGNVFEFVEDCFFPDYNGAPTDGTPWVASDQHPESMNGEVCRHWAIRGYFFDSIDIALRSAARCHGIATWDDRLNALGLRVAVSLSETAWDLKKTE